MRRCNDGLFHVVGLAALLASWCLTASAGIHSAAPVIIEVLLDNSPSMEIGATAGDIAAMMYLTPCSEPGAVYPFRYQRTPFGGVSPSRQTYSAYQCAAGNNYDGQLPPFDAQACPIPAPRGVIGAALLKPSLIGPRCNRLSGAVATAGAPCAFACHWDTHSPPGASRDYYGLARSTIGQPPCYQHGAQAGACAITLRFDLVKNAVARLIDTIEEDDFAGLAKFTVGVSTFDTDLHSLYPPPSGCGAHCVAGRDWALALGSVGSAPNLPNVADKGIQPFIGMNQGSTDLPGALTALARADMEDAVFREAETSTRKALFLITDGLDDHIEGGGRFLGPLDPRVCQTYKSMGFEVFVLYTPYYPLMNPFYLANVSRIAEGHGAGSIEFGLRQCASDPVSSFIAAMPNDPASISNALQIFLKRTLALTNK